VFKENMLFFVHYMEVPFYLVWIWVSLQTSSCIHGKLFHTWLITNLNWGAFKQSLNRPFGNTLRSIWLPVRGLEEVPGSTLRTCIWTVSLLLLIVAGRVIHTLLLRDFWGARSTIPFFWSSDLPEWPIVAS
jgi:hypothetical protein